MTKEINTDEEILETDTPETLDASLEEPAAQEPQVPVISSVDQVEPISSLELFNRALLLLHSSAEDDDNNKLYVDSLYRKHFGDDYTEQNYNADFTDEGQLAVVTDYIRDRLDYVKTNATSLNKNKIDKSFENIFSLVGLNISISNSVEELYDDIFTKRAEQNAFLLEDYEVLKINRQLYHIYENTTSITELSGLTTAIEDLATSIDGNQDNVDFKTVSNEQLAQFYYNVSEIYENEANRKSNMPDVNKWHYRSIEYKKKALDKTSRNIVMVSNIQNDWKNYGDYNPQKIIETCDRIIDNQQGSDRDKYRAHRLCADTLLDLQVIDGFTGRKTRIDKVIEHYRAAMMYTRHKEDKIDILNNISKVQKSAYPQDYIKTRLEMTEMLEGRPRIREYARLSDLTKDEDFKIAMLKSCINEFHELDEPGIEDRRLYEKIDKKLRNLTPPEDKKTIKVLNKLKNKFGILPEKDNDIVFSVMSSAGHDYFSK